MAASDSKGVVITAVDGAPSSEQKMASSKLFDVQAPQSPTPLTITCARASSSARCSCVIATDGLYFFSTK